MIGFSCYLNDSATEQQAAYLKQMQQAGFTGVFTSLQLSEAKPEIIRQRLDQLVANCHQLGLTIMADVSAASLQRLGIALHDGKAIQALGLDGLRIDDGIDMTTVAALSHTMAIALNASTLSACMIDQLANAKANLCHIEAWHNFYPRPETGLDPAWFAQKINGCTHLGLKPWHLFPAMRNNADLYSLVYQHLKLTVAYFRLLPIWNSGNWRSIMFTSVIRNSARAVLPRFSHMFTIRYF